MSPIDVQDLLERAKGCAQLGDHGEAERLLKTYMSKNPESREARLLLGTTFVKEGKLDEAAGEFSNLLAGNPGDIEALNNIAVVYRRQGKLQDALGALVEAIDLEPTRAEFHYNIGNIHKQLGNQKAASMAYAKVIELDPDYVPAYNNLGTIYDQLKEYNKAFTVFNKGLALDRNNPTLHFNYGVALEATQRLDEAAAEYKAALRSKPGWVEPMNNLGIILFKQGRHTKALETFNRILHADPFNAEALNNMGVVKADQGRISEAVKNYRRAIESDPKYTRAVINLERALEDSGDFADALTELEKLVKLAPDSVETHNRLAALYLKMERYPEALEQASAALEWDPHDVEALRVKGTVERISGSDEEAKATFEKILSIDPGNFAFHLDLADIHFRRKEYREAEDRIMAYLAMRPGDREAKLLLGKLNAEMGNRTHAIQIFEELAKADPNDTEALSAAAELHRDAGSVEKALRTADAIVNLRGQRATSDDLSELNKSLEFYEKAVSAYSGSVKEMWDKNIKLLGGASEDRSGVVSAMLDYAGMSRAVSRAVDEESEILFYEGKEFSDGETSGDLFSGAEDQDDIAGDYSHRYSPPALDSLAEPEETPFNFDPESQRVRLPERPEEKPLPPGKPAPKPSPELSPSKAPPPEPAAAAEDPVEDENLFEEPELPDIEPLLPEAAAETGPIVSASPGEEPSVSGEEEDEGVEEIDLSLVDDETEDAVEGIPEGEIPEETLEDETLEEEILPEEELPVEDEALEDAELFPGEEPPVSGEEGTEDETASGETDNDTGTEDTGESAAVPEEEEAAVAEDSSQSSRGAAVEIPPAQEELLPVEKDKLLELLMNLVALTDSLPENNRTSFQKSGTRIKLEYIINALEGRKGLLRKTEERYNP